MTGASLKRRELLKSLPGLAAAASLRAAPETTHSRIRPGLVAYSFRKQLEAKTMTYEALIRYVSELGLDGLDTTVYWFPDTSDSFLASLRNTAYKQAVQLHSIATRVRLCQPTPELQMAEFETAKKWVEVAERVAAGHVRVFGGSIPKGATEPQAIDWAVEVLKRSADYAGSKGIILGVEDDGGLTATAEPTLEIVRRTGSPWVGVNLDTGNFPRDGYSQVEKCIPYATNVHFKQHIAGADGMQEKADWDRLAAMFAKAGYKGYLALEYEEPASAESAIPGLTKELIRCARKYSA